MSVIERAPRVITCGECRASFEASPYGPAPDRCRDCRAQKDRERGRADRVRRSALEGRRMRGPYRDGITRTAMP